MAHRVKQRVNRHGTAYVVKSILPEQASGLMFLTRKEKQRRVQEIANKQTNKQTNLKKKKKSSGERKPKRKRKRKGKRKRKRNQCM